jgi:drug/metabolite transporter (DMT)-like permease
VFNAIDYGAMPVMTLAAAGLALRERPTRAQVLGGLLGGIGVVVLCLVPDPQRLGTSSSWALWLAISFVSPILTAACSAIQKRLLNAGYSPADVLILRFPISAVVFGAWMLAGDHRVESSALPGLIGVTIVGAFVPLWLLCFGLLRRGLSSLAGFLLLIPVFTFALGPLVVSERWSLLMSPWIVGGTALLILGYLLAEGYIGNRPTPAS